MEMLSVDEIRRLAQEEGYIESAVGNEVLLFVKERSSNETSNVVVDVPVYCEAYTGSGDVAVILPHPRQKSWRLFHFGALYSADTLRNVLQLPFSDSNFSYILSDIATVQPPSPPTIALQQSLERQIALIDREVSDLQRERLELCKKLKSLTAEGSSSTGNAAGPPGVNNETLYKTAMQQPLPDPRGIVDDVRLASAASDMLVSRANGDRARGNKGVWSMFYPDAQEAFARAWTSKSVNSVALGRGFVVNYDDGSATWSDISPLLESKLKQQGVNNPNGLSSKLSGPISNLSSTTGPVVRIRYLVLGDEGNFYVKFDNGRMEWCGQDSFGAALRRGVSERRLLVEKVAFAREGGWLIIWSDRTFEAENIPETLEQRLGGTRTDEDRIVGTASDIKDVTLGPAGEWFIIYKDHSVQADNLPDGLYKCLSQIREKSGRVRTIAFGENRSWFVRYWDGNR